MKKRKEITIASTVDKMYLVEGFVEQISDEYLLGDNYFGNMMVAVTEAVKNAIEHGSGDDKTKRVVIRLEADKEGLWISVTDQGEGFDSEKYVGREIFMSKDIKAGGLALINALADEVRFRENGRIIEMLFCITGIEERIIEQRQNLMARFFQVSHPEKKHN